MKITEMIRSGDMAGTYTDTDELLADAGRRLDKACSYDICGEVIFKGEDGKHYVMNVEAVIEEVNPEYLKEILAQDAEDDESMAGSE